MTTFYVNSISGSNANNGLSAATAKQTLQATADAASNGDTIIMRGVFSESVNLLNRTLDFIGDGAVIDGLGTHQFRKVGGAVTLRDLTFRRLAGLELEVSFGFTDFWNCAFRDMTNGIIVEEAERIYVRNCRFFNLTNGIHVKKYYSAEVRNCIFAGNAASLYAPSTFCDLKVRNNIFADPLMIHLVDPLRYTEGAENLFDFAGGTRSCFFDATSYTSLASWMAATTREYYSEDIDLSGVFNDPAKGAVRLLPHSDLLHRAPSGLPWGVMYPGISLSANRNSSVWSNGVFTSTEINGDGDIELSSGATLGTYRSGVVDFGARLPVFSVEISETGDSAALDYSTGETPGAHTLRVRGSDNPFLKTDTDLPWTEVRRVRSLRDVLPDWHRYWQVELTLRSGVGAIQSVTFVVPPFSNNAALPVISAGDGDDGGGGAGSTLFLPSFNTNWRD